MLPVSLIAIMAAGFGKLPEEAWVRWGLVGLIFIGLTCVVWGALHLLTPLMPAYESPAWLLDRRTILRLDHRTGRTVIQHRVRLRMADGGERELLFPKEVYDWAGSKGAEVRLGRVAGVGLIFRISRDPGGGRPWEVVRRWTPWPALALLIFFGVLSGVLFWLLAVANPGTFGALVYVVGVSFALIGGVAWGARDW